jgi:hypothetical protein
MVLLLDLEIEDATQDAYSQSLALSVQSSLLHLLPTNPHRVRGLRRELRALREDAYRQGQVTALCDTDTG